MRFRSLFALGAATLAGACQTIQSTNDAAVDYNRAFARARDEITVLNVLRASQRQPLQFSTVSSVQGAVRSGASVRVPFINLIDGGPNVISPEVTLSARNPTVSIAPLATREFILGLSRPLSPGVIDDLLVQGWPIDVVLGLTIGGVVCANGTSRLNSGEDQSVDQLFLSAFRNISDFGFAMSETRPDVQLRMSGKEALAALREGAGEQRRIASVVQPPGSDEAIVQLVTPGQPSIRGIDFRAICGSGTAIDQHAPDKAQVPAAGRQGGVVMRSVFGIFHYLGKAQAAIIHRQLAACGAPDPPGFQRLFYLEVACATRPAPLRPLVSTRFDGRRYVLRRGEEAPASDRTLETLSLLTYLVDLQTSETAVKASIPFIAITQP